MRLKIRKSQLELFRKKARNNPNEIMAVMVGFYQTPHELHIVQFKYPKLATSTPTEVSSCPQSATEIEQDAEAENLKVIGTIHSHPNWDAVMSPTDYQSHIEDGDKVSGIVSINYGRTRVFFWTTSSSLPLEYEYI